LCRSAAGHIFSGSKPLILARIGLLLAMIGGLGAASAPEDGVHQDRRRVARLLR